MVLHLGLPQHTDAVAEFREEAAFLVGVSECVSE